MCRREVKVIARPLREPPLDGRGLVGPVVVEDDVHVHVRENLGINGVEELAELNGVENNETGETDRKEARNVRHDHQVPSHQGGHG